MKVLILGGDGFIGSHLRNAHLMLEDEVYIVDQNEYRSNPTSKDYYFEKYDLSWKPGSFLYNTCIGYKPDLIYNCVAVATPSYYVKYPTETFQLDFEVNKKIIDELNRQNIPFIHFSSSEVYGKRWNAPYKEDSDCILGPASKSRWIYATSKLLLDQYILGESMNCCILRPFNFIGHDIDWLPDIDKAQNKDKTWLPRVPSCFLNALFTKTPMKVVLPGTQQRCYTYIDDAIQGIIQVADHWLRCKGEILNIGNPNNETSIEGLADKMRKCWANLTGETPPDYEYVRGTELYGKGYEDSERRLFYANKMTEMTGWEAQTGLDETIENTVKDALEEWNR